MLIRLQRTGAFQFKLKRRPRLDLHVSGLADVGLEPVGNEGVKTGKCHPWMLGGVTRRVKAGLPLPWHQQREAEESLSDSEVSHIFP